jgi:hypothetical protein
MEIIPSKETNPEERNEFLLILLIELKWLKLLK